MFKIVQTTEKGLKHLIIVPSAWEKNSHLSWPRVGADKLVTNVNSVPEANWFRTWCKLKRNHLINYEIAEKELKRMLENDNTEQEEVESMKRKKRAGVTLPTTNPIDSNFNSLTNACLMPLIKKTVESPSATTSEVFMSQTMLGRDDNSYQVEILPNDKQIESLLVTDTLTTSMDPQLNEKLDNILANQTIIIEKQQTIIDNFNTCSCQTTKRNLIANKEDIFFNPIETLEELEALENKLADKNGMEDYVQMLSYVCGRKGFGDGLSNCYILVDKIFSRKFMTECSWAGGARDKKEKIPFKIFKNVINLFFQVVKLSDEDFTLKNCEEFFKAVIRNSTKRNESSLARSSRAKRRPTSLSYKARRGKDVGADRNEDAAADAIGFDENDIGEIMGEVSQTDEKVAADVIKVEKDEGAENFTAV